MHGPSPGTPTPASLALAVALAAGGGGTASLALWAVQAASDPMARAVTAQAAMHIKNGFKSLELDRPTWSPASFCAGAAVATALCLGCLGLCLVCGGAAAAAAWAHAAQGGAGSDGGTQPHLPAPPGLTLPPPAPLGDIADMAALADQICRGGAPACSAAAKAIGATSADVESWARAWQATARGPRRNWVAGGDATRTQRARQAQARRA